MTLTSRAAERIEWFKALLSVILVTIRVEWGLHHRGLPQLAASLGLALPASVGNPGPPGPPIATLPPWARGRLDLAMWVLHRWPFGNTCLRRALVGGHQLRELRPELHVGVLKEGGLVTAHAWLVIAGRSLDPTSGRYAALGDVP